MSLNNLMKMFAIQQGQSLDTFLRNTSLQLDTERNHFSIALHYILIECIPFSFFGLHCFFPTILDFQPFFNQLIAFFWPPGLELDPSNDACIKGIQDVNAAIFSTPLMFKRSFGPDVWERIKLRPQLAPYLEQSDYVELIKMVQKSGTEENATKMCASNLFQLGVLMCVHNFEHV